MHQKISRNKNFGILVKFDLLPYLFHASPLFSPSSFHCNLTHLRIRPLCNIFAYYNFETMETSYFPLGGTLDPQAIWKNIEEDLTNK